MSRQPPPSALEGLSQTILDRLRVGVVLFRIEDPADPGRMVVEWTNEAASRLLGRRRGEAWGLPLLEVMPQLVSSEAARLALESAETRVVTRLGRVTVEIPGGSDVALELTAMPLEARRLAVVFEVDASSAAGGSLISDPRSLVGRLFETLDDAVFVIDPAGRRIVLCNAAVERIFGHRPEDLIGRSTEVLHLDPARYQEFGRAGEPILGVEGAFRSEVPMRHRDGRRLETEVSVYPLRDDAGWKAGVVSVIRDVTERKQAEEEKRHLVDDLGERIKELRVVHETARLLQEPGLPVADLLGRAVQILPPGWLHPEGTGARIRLGELEVATVPKPEGAPSLSEDLRMGSIGGEIEVFLLEPESADAVAGEPFLEEEKVLLRSVAELLGSHLDHRASEEAVNRSRERLSLALEINRLGIWDWFSDSEWMILDRRCHELLGFEGEEFESGWKISGWSWFEGIHPDDRDEARARWDAAFDGSEERLRNEYRYRRPDRGDELWLSVRARVVHRAPDGRARRIVGTLADVTARRQAELEREALEAQLRQAQKMESVGRLAGGIAHDFNNVLTAILGYADLLDAELPPGSPEQEDLAEIRAAADRAARLTGQLLAFSRQQILEPVVLDVNDVLASTLRMLGRLLGEDVEIVPLPASDLWPVEIDPGGLEQILLNLAVNARDAMPRGGTLTIETRNRVLDAQFVETHLGSRAGAHVELSVADTGIGMDNDVLARAFDPFYTTKKAGEGTGLGLSTVYGIVKQSDGYIVLESRPDEGTQVSVLLPRVDAPLDAPLVEAPDVTLEGDETVLLVEDEAELRKLVHRLLTGSGYRVLEAEGADQAIDRAAVHEGPIDLLLTDVIMPGRNGRELAGELQRSRPELRILYMSGYTEEVFQRYGIEEIRGRIVTKPFTREELLRRVRRALDG